MLRITRLTDYATVVLAALAAQADMRSSATELAERCHLEVTTVAKVLKMLAHAHIVEGQRGAGGGYRLSRDAQHISLIAIIEAMEGPLAMTTCASDDGHCELEHHCHLRGNWQRINAIIADALHAVSLADLAGTAGPAASVCKHIPMHISSV